MLRAYPVRSLYGLLLCLLLVPGCSRQSPSPRRPNVVIILVDDLGYGDLSTYGGWIETPHLDRMAAEGLRFTDFHASAPVCSPTRAGLLTGRYQQRAGLPGVVYANPARNRHHGLHVAETTFAERLQQAGYATALFGKWHLGYESRYNPIHHGFDRFRGYLSGNVDYFSHVDQMGFYDWWEGDQQVEEPGYVTRLITRHAVQFIEAHQDQPFCLYLAHEAPHYPFQGPNDAAFRVVGEQIGEDREPERVRRAYREMVQEMDTGIGEVMQTLERLGLADETLVLFFSDNGATADGSNGALRGFKGSLWEGGHRVPALAWWAGRIAPGGVTEAPAISLDVMPTILEAAGVTLPEEHRLDGVSLLPLLLDGEAPAPRTLFWAYQEQAALRRGPWKLVVEATGQEGVALYNLDADFGETIDLSDAEPQRVEALMADLEAWRLDVSNGATLQPSR